jgi:tetratricopeptide (TPR) repeat protein
MNKIAAGVLDDLPELDAVIAHELTEDGWRGLTENGVILNITGINGHKIVPPEGEMLVARGGRTIGRRAIADKYKIHLDDYIAHHDRGVELFKANQYESALAEFETAVALAPTAWAQFNRALVLLTLGRWAEGLEYYEARLPLYNSALCREAVRRGIPRWRGEDLCGKKLLLVHDAGFGDTIQMLRYAPMLLERGAHLKLFMPPQLCGLAEQVAPLAEENEGADYYCPMLSLLFLLRQTVETIPNDPYLQTDPALVQRWRERIGTSERRRTGIAWSVGQLVEGDYPRAIPLQLLGEALGDDDVFSIQTQGAGEARALGIETFEFEDFADCAALVSLMDRIVTVDTAATHVAGAIGHPNITLLLSHWSSWRWIGNRLYRNMKLCRQTSAGDWASALAQI